MFRRGSQALYNSIEFVWLGRPVFTRNYRPCHRVVKPSQRKEKATIKGHKIGKGDVYQIHLSEYFFPPRNFFFLFRRQSRLHWLFARVFWTFLPPVFPTFVTSPFNALPFSRSHLKAEKNPPSPEKKPHYSVFGRKSYRPSFHACCLPMEAHSLPKIYFVFFSVFPKSSSTATERKRQARFARAFVAAAAVARECGQRRERQQARIQRAPADSQGPHGSLLFKGKKIRVFSFSLSRMLLSTLSMSLAQLIDSCNGNVVLK